MNDKNLIVLSSPSGGGKSTVARHLMALYPSLKFSVSATTRSMRPGESYGKEYFFLTKEEFQIKIDENELIEYEEIFGNFYGTLKNVVQSEIASGNCLLFDVDVKGALSIQNFFPDNSLLIFLSPPDLPTLESRLRNRKTETDEQIQNRLSRAEYEMSLAYLFDYVIINDDLNITLKKAEEIVAKNIIGPK